MEEIEVKRKANKIFGLEHWKGIALILAVYDIFAVSLSYFVALWLRFDCRYSQIPDNYYSNWLRFAPIYIVFSLFCFSALKLYRSFARATYLRNTSFAIIKEG